MNRSIIPLVSLTLLAVPAATPNAHAETQGQASGATLGRVLRSRREPVQLGNRQMRRGHRGSRNRRWSFRSKNVRSVTYSVDPRSPDSIGAPKTGDLILTAEPKTTKVNFYLQGGNLVLQPTDAVVKNHPLPKGKKKLYILAVAPGLRARTQAFVPLKPNSITTVRFVFGGPRTAMR